jgi:hypothetical protein
MADALIGGRALQSHARRSSARRRRDAIVAAIQLGATALDILFNDR